MKPQQQRDELYRLAASVVASDSPVFPPGMCEACGQRAPERVQPGDVRYPGICKACFRRPVPMRWEEDEDNLKEDGHAFYENCRDAAVRALEDIDLTPREAFV